MGGTEPGGLGALLRMQRRAAGMTQEALAAQAGVGVRTLQDLERGATHPLPDTLRRLADALALTGAARAAFTAAGARPPWRAGGAATGNGMAAPPLPLPLTSFVGREAERGELIALLATVRLLTLTGPGGIGKTRLALQVAAEARGRFPDGVWLVDCAPLSDPARVPQAVAAALRIRAQPGQEPGDAVGDALRARRALLLLDNIEHVLAASAALATALLRACPSVQLLATSREALGIGGERRYPVPPLAAPPPAARAPGAMLETSAAVRLFVARAAAAAPGFALTTENAAAVAEVCRRLDGIPLALELAAARMAALTPGQLAARLDRRFLLLATGERSALPRQQTLRATVDWSYDLLAPAERTVFARLSVFAASWTLEAAEAVGAGGDVGAGEVAALLARLVERSLVTIEPGPSAGRRYRLLETLRQYGEERLSERGAVAAARERHAAYYLALAEQAAGRFPEAGQAGYLAALAPEHEELRRAGQYLLGLADAARAERLARAVATYWARSGHFAEGLAYLRTLLARGPATLPPDRRAWLLQEAAMLAWFSGDLPSAQACAAEAVAARRRVGDPLALAFALFVFGQVAREAEEVEAARAAAEEALALARQAGRPYALGQALNLRGSVAHAAGDYAGAQTWYDQHLALSRELGIPQAEAWAIHHLGCLALERGDLAAAAALLGRDLRLALSVGNRGDAAEALALLASLAAARGERERAWRRLGAVDRVNATMGHHMQRMVTRALDRWAGAAAADAAASRAYADGQALSWEQAVAEALRETAAAPDEGEPRVPGGQ